MVELMIFKDKIELQKKYNTLELKYETLKDQVKEDCFKTLLKVLSEQNDVERLRKENAKLRKRIKELKATIK